MAKKGSSGVKSTTTEIDYNDKRFTDVKAEEKAAIKESNKTYNQMINASDKFYNSQIKASENWGNQQAQLQQQETDFAIEKVNQQKEQAYKDYKKEQKGAWVDYQKQSNDYGSNAEQMADNGLAHTGYSESSKVAMYNTYQNRYAVARETYNRAVLDYDNMITQARLENNRAKAEIAYKTLQSRLELALQGFQYKNSLVLEKANKKAEIKDRYNARWQNVLQQINTEKSMAEQIRQYNESMREQKRQFDETMAFNKAKEDFKSGGGGKSGSSKSKSGSGSGSGNNTPKNINGNVTDDTGNKPKKKKEPVIDMGSVTKLGYGPISEAKLNELVASGKVIEVEKNGVLTFERAPMSKTNRTNLFGEEYFPKAKKK
jgi:hypothetical protein